MRSARSNHDGPNPNRSATTVHTAVFKGLTEIVHRSRLLCRQSRMSSTTKKPPTLRRRRNEMRLSDETGAVCPSEQKWPHTVERGGTVQAKVQNYQQESAMDVRDAPHVPRRRISHRIWSLLPRPPMRPAKARSHVSQLPPARPLFVSPRHVVEESFLDISRQKHTAEMSSDT